MVFLVTLRGLRSQKLLEDLEILESSGKFINLSLYSLLSYLITTHKLFLMTDSGWMYLGVSTIYATF